jgi:hypothetical protein
MTMDTDAGWETWIMPSQGVTFVAALGAGVFIYAAVTDNSIISVLTGKATSGNGDVEGDDTATAGAAEGGAAGSAGDGSGAAIVTAAESALGFTSGYAEVRPMPTSLAACAASPTDCSGYATLSYKEAGMPDPNHLGYNGEGYTGTLIQHGRKVSKAQPGDLHFWEGPGHVAIDVGNGEICEWGAPPGPVKVSLQDEMKYHAAYLGARTYMTPATKRKATIQAGTNVGRHIGASE